MLVFILLAIGPNSLPISVAVLVITGGCGAASAGLSAAFTIWPTQHGPVGLSKVLEPLAVIGLAGFPALVMGVAGLSPWLAVEAIIAVTGATAHIWARRESSTRRVRVFLAAVVGACAILGWLSLQISIFVFDTQPAIIAWIVLRGLSSGFIGFIAFAAILLVAARRRQYLRPFIHRPAATWLVLVVAGIAITIVALRLTVARSLFGEVDAILWRVGEPSGWLHAVAVAVLIVVLVIRSAKRPLKREYSRTASWTLLLGGGAGTLLFALSIAGRSLWAGYTEVLLPLDVLVLRRVGLVISVLAALSMSVYLAPRFRSTAAFAFAAVAIAYSLPLAVASFVGDLIPLPPIWALPTVVILVIDVLVVCRLLVGLQRSEGRQFNSVYLALLISPVVLIHAGSLVPEVVSSGNGNLAVILGCVFALLWFLPPTSSDRARHTRTLLGASATQLTLLIATFMDQVTDVGWQGGPIDTRPLETALGTMLLALPLTVALCVGLAPRVPSLPKNPDLLAPGIQKVEPESQGLPPENDKA
ncbi:MAG: hypothetical protein LH624_17910 [Cryobacterium sp.]|nr:hypothetical protein [Cryobacterium sp.]